MCALWWVRGGWKFPSQSSQSAEEETEVKGKKRIVHPKLAVYLRNGVAWLLVSLHINKNVMQEK